MTMGLQIFGPAGQTWLDTNMITWLIADVFFVAAGDSATKTYDALSGREFLPIQVPVNVPRTGPGQGASLQKLISVSASTVTVSSQSGDTDVYVIVACR